MAFSVKIPFGLPSSPSSMVPPATPVFSSTPASSIAFVLVTKRWPQTLSNTIGISVDILSKPCLFKRRF